MVCASSTVTALVTLGTAVMVVVMRDQADVALDGDLQGVSELVVIIVVAVAASGLGRAASVSAPLIGEGGLGTDTPPITNTAPRLGVDPHGVTGREPSAQDQFSRFIDGELIDVCGDAPCYAAGWTGP